MTSSNLKTSEAVVSKLSGSQIYQDYLILTERLDKGDLTLDMDEFGIAFERVMKLKKDAIRELVLEEPELYFITVNPKPDITLDMLMKHVHNFCSRRSVRDYFYSIEQRGETEETMGNGIHSHILVEWNKKDNKYIKQFLFESCKRIVGSNMPQILNIRRITKNVFQDKLDYLNGIKWDTEKDLKIKYDIKFREINKISPLYKKDGI